MAHSEPIYLHITHFLQKDRKEQNQLKQNIVHLLPSYTHETAQENSSSKTDTAKVRPSIMDLSVAHSSTSARQSFIDPLTVFENDSLYTLDCPEINIQKETQITNKKDNSTTDCSVGEMVPTTTDCSVGEMVPPATDCSFGEFVPPPISCGVEVMGTLTNDCCIWDDLVQETEELSNMPSQIGEVAGSSMHAYNPQYFHAAKSKSYTDTVIQVSQNDTVLVNQIVYDSVRNNHINEMRKPKIKACSVQEEPNTQHLMNMLTVLSEAPPCPLKVESFTSDQTEFATQSELFNLRQDSSDHLDLMQLLSLRDNRVKFPQQKGNETNNPPENTLANRVTMTTKDVIKTDEDAINKTEEHGNKGREDDSDKSGENETKKMPSEIIQQTNAESCAAKETVAVEMRHMTRETS